MSMTLRSITTPMPTGPRHAAPLADLRFRQLLGARAWDCLPDTVQQRFGKRLGPGQSASYAGQVLDCRMSIAGWLLAQACRLIGAPLPLERGGDLAAVVSVTEDGASGGQVWTRLYARRQGFPQVIHSAKRFAGPTGLEEYLGLGFGIALTVSAEDQGIRFASDHYFLRLGRLRLKLPRLLAPGHLTIDHLDRGAGAFTFTLALRHRLLGELMRQTSLFHDQTQAGDLA
ncbi:DUF4166 domain-containing protein [Novosphingobium terrae]|uniref:DUF4166 domain-containing protein n=1 Tax=Novosphingobium terrae TaxID=2726189 RepID=UPI002AC31777|nr:DUF4166 domain-containing protein [Novosphingobium terrae]